MSRRDERLSIDRRRPLVGIPDLTFNLPLQSVESATPIDDFTLLVGLDISANADW